MNRRLLPTDKPRPQDHPAGLVDSWTKVCDATWERLE